MQHSLALQAGIDIPQTWLLDSTASLEALKSNSKWPLILKGREVNAWRETFGGSIKGFVVNSYPELAEKLAGALKAQIPVIAQEIIAGPDSNHYKYCAYISREGKTLAQLTLRKIRQWPVRFGVGSVVESIHDAELVEAGSKFFRGIGYTGVGSAEFKKDSSDGKLKLIELNPRYWQQNALAEACGVNFAWINYQDLMGQDPIPVDKHKAGIKWVNHYLDFCSFLAYNREGALSFCSWRKSLKGKKIHSDFSGDDPLPALLTNEFAKKILHVPAFLWKRVVG